MLIVDLVNVNLVDFRDAELTVFHCILKINSFLIKPIEIHTTYVFIVVFSVCIQCIVVRIENKLRVGMRRNNCNY